MAKQATLAYYKITVIFKTSAVGWAPSPSTGMYGDITGRSFPGINTIGDDTRELPSLINPKPVGKCLV